jgi:hypothetical protein
MENNTLCAAGSAIADTAVSACSSTEGAAGVAAVATAATTLAVAAAAVTALASDNDARHDKAQEPHDADDSEQPALTSTGRPVRAARLAAAAAAAASKRAELEASNRAKGVRRTPARKTAKPKAAAKKGTDDDATNASASSAGGPFALVPSQPSRKLPSQQLGDADRHYGYMPTHDAHGVFYPGSAQPFSSAYRPTAGSNDDLLSGGSLLSSFSQQTHNPEAIAALRNLKASTPPQRNSSASSLSSPATFNMTDAQLLGSSMALDEHGDPDAPEDAQHLEPLGIMGAYGTPYGHLGRLHDGRIVQLYPPVERASQACELCRRRKARCSGGLQCERCKKGGHTCVYAQIDRARGVKETKPHDQLLADSTGAKLAADARVSTPPTQVSDGATPDAAMHKSPNKTMSSIAARGRGKKAALGLQTASTRTARPPPRSAGIDASSFLEARDIAPMPHTAHGGYFTGLEGFASSSSSAKEHTQTHTHANSFSSVASNEAPMYSPMQQSSGGFVHDAVFAAASQQHSQRQHQESSLQQAHYQQQRQQQPMAAPTSTRPLLMQQRHSWQAPSSTSGQQHAYYATSTGYERLDSNGYYFQQPHAQQPHAQQTQPQQHTQQQQQTQLQQQVQEHVPQQTHTATNYQYSTSAQVPSQTSTSSSTSNLAHIYSAQPHRSYSSSSVAQQPYHHAAPQYGPESLSAGATMSARPIQSSTSHAGHHEQSHGSHGHGSTAPDGGPATFEQLETTTSSARGYRDFVLASSP